MATTADRVDELLAAPRRDRRTLMTPEGVPLELSIAGRGERLAAFGLDFAILLGTIFVLSLLLDLLVVQSAGEAVAKTLVQFAAFLVRSLYFVHFELAWQGATPGKRASGLRVINRDGGELTAGAVIARNIVREAEFFLPLSLLLSIDADAGLGWQYALAGWAVLGAGLPLWNRDRLRVGDLIAGTQVISMPKRALARDLSVRAQAGAKREHVFTREQLSKYGAYELQVLEELLRRPQTPQTEQTLDDVCRRICRKIDWAEPVPSQKVRGFLADFYAAEREDLERGKLFGRLREDKYAAGRGK